MMAFSKTLFFLFLLAVFILEGTGFLSGREITRYLILFGPFILFLSRRKELRKIVFPNKLTIFFILFFTFSIASTAFSLNVQRSFEYLLFYISIFLLFIYVLNNKEKIKPWITSFILSLSVLFSLYSIVLKSFIEKNIAVLVPTSGYQLVYSKFLSHNHLGDFLVLAVIICFFFLLSREKKEVSGYKIIIFLLLLFFIPYFIFSYSRSAYASLTIVGFIMLFYLIRERKISFFSSPSIFLVSLIIVTFAFFFLTVKDIETSSTLRAIHGTLVSRYELKDKYFLAGRDSFYREAFLSIRDKPLFGVGPGNFENSSKKYTNVPTRWTETAHNVFLDMLSENGVLAGAIFVAIIFLLLKNSKKNILFFLFLAMFLNFQTDYAYRIYSFFVLFFVLGGLIYQEKETIEIRFLPRIALAIALFAVLMLASQVFSKQKNYDFAFYTYPLNQNVYQPMIQDEFQKGDTKRAFALLNIYGVLFRGDPSVQNYVGGVYESHNQIKLALTFYERGYQSNPFFNFSIVEKIYELKAKEDGGYAKEFIDGVFRRVEEVEEKWSIPEEFRISTMKLCQKIYNLHCLYDL